MVTTSPLLEAAISRVVYVDVFGREVTSFSELRELLPPKLQVPTYDWQSRQVQRVPWLGAGAAVLRLDRWDTLRRLDLHPNLFAPAVFSLDGLVYGVDTRRYSLSENGPVEFVVNPVATKIGTQVLANADPQPVIDDLRSMRWFFQLRCTALVHAPALSFRAVAEAGIDLIDVRVLDYSVKRPGGTLFEVAGSGRFLSRKQRVTGLHVIEPVADGASDLRKLLRKRA